MHKKLNILLIEDDRIEVLKFNRTVKSGLDHEITLANNGREALEKLKSFLPDVILLDLNMPDTISIEVLNPLPTIKGDRTKLQQLFQNLIGNSIKYNDKENGYIKIDVKEQPSFYEFSIKDNGIGIEKKHFNKIFKIFQALKKSKNSSGIGLSIVKKIVDMYGG